jgi:tetratricopeptide (TPR) repeat protein
VALGTVYLDRHRLEDALREFGDAIRQDPRRADVHRLMAQGYALGNKPAEAALALVKAADLEPGNPIALYELARTRLKMGQSEEARNTRETFRLAVERRLTEARGADTASAPFERVGLPRPAGAAPIFPPALYSSGFALVTQGDYGEALIRFRQAANLDTPSADVADASDPLAQGSAALRQGDLQSALDHLREAVRLAPGRAEAHRALATAYWADEQYDHSIEQFEAAVRANPNDERSWTALADVLATVGQFTHAEQVLKEALRAIPGSGQAHYGLGRLYKSMARQSEAVRELEAAANFNPLVGQDPLYEMLGGIYLAQSDFDRAAEAYAKQVDINPNNAGAHRRLGEARLRQDRDDEALAEFMAALLIDPHSADAYGAIAQVHLRTSRYAEAATASRRAVELDPTLKEARYALGTALMRLGQVEEGSRQIEEFQRLQAEATARAGRKRELDRIERDAAVSLASADYEKAVGLLRQAISHESTVAADYMALGFALMETGHHSEAIVNFQKASQLEPGPDVHRYLAEAYRALGRLDESRSETDAYRRMVELAKKERLRKMSGSP